MGGQFEVKDGATKKYYSIAGMMVAVHDGTALQYILTDHLGSTVAVTNQSGTLTSQQRYLPFGAARTIPNSPILGTDFTYTGQRKLDDGMGGVMDYKARFYSPMLGRFQQPDTIIPNPANPQSMNRYAYVLANPIRYNDPTGHMVACDNDDWACQYHWDEPIATEQLNKKYSRKLTKRQEQAWEFFIGASEFAVSVAVEPVDWLLTYDEYKRNGFNPWMLLGLLPYIPGSAGRHADDLVQMIPDNAFVRFDPSKFDSSIDEVGLRTIYDTSGKDQLWLTQYKYVKDIVNPQDLETILYRKNLWPETTGKFADGATLRVVNIDNAIPAGISNMTNGIPQWFITHDVPPSLLQVITRLLP